MTDEPTKENPGDGGWTPFTLTLSDNPYIDWVLGDGAPFIAGADDGGREWYSALLSISGVGIDTARRARKGDDGVVTRVLDALASDDPSKSLEDVEDIVAQKQTPDSASRNTRTDADGDRTLSVFVRAGMGAEPRTAIQQESVFAALFGPRMDPRIAAEPGLDEAVPSRQIGIALRHESISTTVEAAETDAILQDFDKEGLVVIGVIDDGIAFANDRFRLPGGGSRVIRAWDQDAPASDNPRVFVGRDWTRTEIDETIARHTNAGLLDEDGFYREIGLNAFAQRDAAGVQTPRHKTAASSRTHGTHVLDTVTGYDRNDPEAKKRPIVTVQLPSSVTWDTSGSGLGEVLVASVTYIFNRAEEIRAACGLDRVPVVINFSYGIGGGPHDGHYIVEKALDQLVQDRIAPGGDPAAGQPTALVIASGNGHLARRHARIRFDGTDAGDMRDLFWRIQPDDRTPSYLEIWMPDRDPADTETRMTVEIIPPGQPPSGLELTETHGAGFVWAPNGEVLARSTYDRRPGDGRGRFMLTLAPTYVLDGARQAAPQGIWTIRLRNRALAPDATVEAWIQRDDTPYGYPRRGRQSILDHPDYELFEDRTDHSRHTVAGDPRETDPSDSELNPIVRRDGSINGLATGETPIVIGACMRRTLKPSPYSAGGSATVKQPDAMAPGDDSRILGGVLGAGTRSGSVTALNGTSVAAPLVAREVARVMGGGAPKHGLTLAAADPWKTYIRDLADAEETARAGTPDIAPRPATARGGHGRIDLPPRIDRIRV